MAMEYPTWEQLMEQGESDTPQQVLLIQAVAALSTQGRFASMTPWEVYDRIVKTAQEIEAAA